MIKQKFSRMSNNDKAKKISRMSNNDKAKIFYHEIMVEIMVVWHNTVLQCSVAKNGRGQVKKFLGAVYCLLGPKILVTPLQVIKIEICDILYVRTCNLQSSPEAVAQW